MTRAADAATPAPQPPLQPPNRNFEYEGGWQGRVYVERRPGSDTLTCRAELFRQGVPVCRIVQVRQNEQEQHAVDVLIGAAIEWIGTWNRRQADGLVAQAGK